MELWAAIDLMGGACVTLVQGNADDGTIWTESPLQLAKRWQDEGADGLHIIDLDAAFGIGSNKEAVMKIIRESRLPVQIGGGIRSLAVAKDWLEAGAARIIIGTLAFNDPTAARGLIEAHGTEKVVVAADYQDGMIVTKGWKERQGLTVLAGAKRMEDLGFTNLLTTAVGRDGMASGPDVATVKQISLATRMKIIGSGGIRGSADVVELKRAGASGAVIGRALYEGTINLKETKEKVS